jgi:hypothetical protein
MPDPHPPLPVDQLRSAVPPEHEAHPTIDALHGELSSERPAPAAIKAHVESLRKHAPLTTLVANWFEDPRTQAFIAELTATGL